MPEYTRHDSVIFLSTNENSVQLASSFHNLFLGNKETREKQAQQTLKLAIDNANAPITDEMLYVSLNTLNLYEPKDQQILINLLDNNHSFRNNFFGATTTPPKRVDINININKISSEFLAAELGTGEYSSFLNNSMEWLSGDPYITDKDKNKKNLNAAIININSEVSLLIKNSKQRLWDYFYNYRDFAYNFFRRWNVSGQQQYIPPKTLLSIALKNPGAALGILTNPVLRKPLLRQLTANDKLILINNATAEAKKTDTRLYYPAMTKLLLSEQNYLSANLLTAPDPVRLLQNGVRSLQRSTLTINKSLLSRQVPQTTRHKLTAGAQNPADINNLSKLDEFAILCGSVIVTLVEQLPASKSKPATIANIVKFYRPHIETLIKLYEQEQDRNQKALYRHQIELLFCNKEVVAQLNISIKGLIRISGNIPWPSDKTNNKDDHNSDNASILVTTNQQSGYDADDEIDNKTDNSEDESSAEVDDNAKNSKSALQELLANQHNLKAYINATYSAKKPMPDTIAFIIVNKPGLWAQLDPYQTNPITSTLNQWFGIDLFSTLKKEKANLVALNPIFEKKLTGEIILPVLIDLPKPLEIIKQPEPKKLRTPKNDFITPTPVILENFSKNSYFDSILSRRPERTNPYSIHNLLPDKPEQLITPTSLEQQNSLERNLLQPVQQQEHKITSENTNDVNSSRNLFPEHLTKLKIHPEISKWLDKQKPLSFTTIDSKLISESTLTEFHEHQRHQSKSIIEKVAATDMPIIIHPDFDDRFNKPPQYTNVLLNSPSKTPNKVENQADNIRASSPSIRPLDTESPADYADSPQIRPLDTESPAGSVESPQIRPLDSQSPVDYFDSPQIRPLDAQSPANYSDSPPVRPLDTQSSSEKSPATSLLENESSVNSSDLADLLSIKSNLLLAFNSTNAKNPTSTSTSPQKKAFGNSNPVNINVSTGQYDKPNYNGFPTDENGAVPEKPKYKSPEKKAIAAMITRRKQSSQPQSQPIIDGEATIIYPSFGKIEINKP